LSPISSAPCCCLYWPGDRRYAHITALRCDPMNPSLLGMRKVVSEDSVHRGLATIGEAKGLPWLQNHLDYCTAPLLSEPWVLDMNSTVKTLYGHKEGAGGRLQSTQT
jgi:hypothetical protein